eukprot:CAMPEP_0182424848 /NCGR_PEP_ID=MMETSP1167-20130531/11110_1 /TAXON_ID=2988 /ORGANISM="Mallomonas Sp, Strain CCMP3275" /LENGTH=97 /DNA_ID=CAMNT_0024604963 /DNA_START=1 /DNA_END=290 /DNA_ORIENTATION=+
MYSYSCKQFPLIAELLVDLEYPRRVPPEPPTVPLRISASRPRSRAQSIGETQLPTAPLDTPAPAPPVSDSAPSSAITNEALLDGLLTLSRQRCEEQT